MIPFLSYSILPAQAIVRNNIHLGHVCFFFSFICIFCLLNIANDLFQVKEDIEGLLVTLSPILYIFHRDIPKPHVLHSSIIQQLTIKVTFHH